MRFALIAAGTAEVTTDAPRGDHSAIGSITGSRRHAIRQIDEGEANNIMRILGSPHVSKTAAVGIIVHRQPELEYGALGHIRLGP
jgi:hypothetical protein